MAACGEAGRPDGADAVAQVRGSENQARGRFTGREEEAGDEKVIVEVGQQESVPDGMCCESQDDFQVSDLDDEIDATAFNSRRENGETILHHLHILQIILNDSHF